MCGRYALYSVKMSPEAFEVRFGFPMPDVYKQPVSYNIGPYRDIPLIYLTGSGQWDYRAMFWQLIPSFAKERKSAYSMFNSRDDSFDKAGFKQELLARQRCIVLANVFYEWKKAGKDKLPYSFSLAGGEVMPLAGIYSIWKSPQGESVYSCSLITVPANDSMAGIHQRMPCILTPDSETLWLDATTKLPLLRGLLLPYPKPLQVRRVSAEVNNVRNNYPELLEDPDMPA